MAGHLCLEPGYWDLVTDWDLDYYSSISFQRYKIFQAAADNSLEVSAWQAVANAVANAWPVGEIW